MLETLKKARELISDPERWCKGVNCRDKRGSPCKSQDATQWCAIGAINHFSYGRSEGRPTMPLHSYSHIFGEINAQFVNDYHGHAAVMTMYDRAIDVLERWPHLEGAD